MAQPADVVRGFLSALGGDDTAAIASYVSDGFVNEHLSTLGDDGVGRAEYLRRLPGFLAAFADRHYAIDDLAVGAAGGEARPVVVRYRFRAIHDGHQIEIPGVMWFVVDGGRITRRTDVWDSLTFLRQTGQA